MHFPYDREKAVNSVLWLLDKHGGQLDLLKLIKLVFFVDREHLRKYARPVVGGKYFAMPLGPVPSELYRTLKEKSKHFKKTGEHQIAALDAFNEDFLSQSDIEILETVNEKYGKLDNFSLSDITHHLKAYKKNWHPETGRKSFFIPYEDFFEDLTSKDKKMIDAVRENLELYDAFN